MCCCWGIWLYCGVWCVTRVGWYLGHSFLSLISTVWHPSFPPKVLFADDIALYRIITTAADYVQLQTDIIDSISSSLMRRSAGRCLFQGRESSFINFNYSHCWWTPPHFGDWIQVSRSHDCFQSFLESKTRRLVGMFYRRFYTLLRALQTRVLQ